MKTHDDCHRGFWIASESWWYRSQDKEYDDEIMVGMYRKDGGTTGEFGIRWLNIGGRSVPQLQVFHDAWHALAQFPDLLAGLASMDSEFPHPKQVASLLRNLGIQDDTNRLPSAAHRADAEYRSWIAALRGAR